MCDVGESGSKDVSLSAAGPCSTSSTSESFTGTKQASAIQAANGDDICTSLHFESIFGDGDTCTLAEQVRVLAQAEFHEDALEIVEAGGVWQAAALASKKSLIGFVVYGCLDGMMSLRYIAVAPKHRGHGHGRHLVEYVCQQCIQHEVRELSLFSRREMVPFYKAVGFQEVPEEEEGDSEDDLQVPMICRVPPHTLEEVKESPEH